MNARVQRIDSMKTPSSAPKYEIRVRSYGPADTELEVWHLPSPASPQVTSPVRVAGLRGRNLELVEHRVLKRLTQAGVKLISKPKDGPLGYAISEDIALMIGLLFRTLAPDALARQHAGGGGRDRADGPRRSRLLARHGDAPEEPPSRAYGASLSPDRTEAQQEELTMSDTRLIERWLPIGAIGEESARERRSMTALPPIYYLHVWWARRPLVASRAAILASLLPADTRAGTSSYGNGDSRRSDAAKRKMEKAKRTGIRVDDPYGTPERLRIFLTSRTPMGQR